MLCPRCSRALVLTGEICPVCGERAQRIPRRPPKIAISVDEWKEEDRKAKKEMKGILISISCLIASFLFIGGIMGFYALKERNASDDEEYVQMRGPDLTIVDLYAQEPGWADSDLYPGNAIISIRNDGVDIAYAENISFRTYIVDSFYGGHDDTEVDINLVWNGSDIAPGERAACGVYLHWYSYGSGQTTVRVDLYYRNRLHSSGEWMFF